MTRDLRPHPGAKEPNGCLAGAAEFFSLALALLLFLPILLGLKKQRRCANCGMRWSE